MSPDEKRVAVRSASSPSSAQLLDSVLTVFDKGGGARQLGALLAAASRGARRLIERAEDLPRLLDFLRGRLEFRPRPDDVYAVTYPRSGTTWLQMILYQLTTDGRMDFDHIGQVAPWFERSLAVGAARAADFEQLASPRVFKSHLPFQWLPEPGRYIYLERDGLDVALSYYHLYRTHLGFAGDFERFFERFLRGELQYRSWFKHVAGWRALVGRPDVLTLRYEDLRADPAGGIDRIADFLGLEPTPAQRRRVHQRCSLEFMKRHEQRFDHITDLLLERGLQRGQFIRDGRSGEGRQALSAAQRRRFQQRCRRLDAGPSPEWDLPAFLH